MKLSLSVFLIDMRLIKNVWYHLRYGALRKKSREAPKNSETGVTSRMNDPI